MLGRSPLWVESEAPQEWTGSAIKNIWRSQVRGSDRSNIWRAISSGLTPCRHMNHMTYDIGRTMTSLWHLQSTVYSCHLCNISSSSWSTQMGPRSSPLESVLLVQVFYSLKGWNVRLQQQVHLKIVDVDSKNHGDTEIRDTCYSLFVSKQATPKRYCWYLLIMGH